MFILKRGLAASILLGALGASGCAGHGDSDARPSEESAGGTLRLPLVTPREQTHRLRNAVFHIQDAQGRSVQTLDSESSPDAVELSAELPRGAYTIELQSGWWLERVEAGGNAAPVQGALVSANPRPFEIQHMKATNLVYAFATNEGTVTFGVGSVLLTFDVVGSEGLAECDLLDPSSCPSGRTCLLADDDGNTFCAVPGALAPGEPCSSEQCVGGAQCLKLDPANPDQGRCTSFCDHATAPASCDCRALASGVGVGVCMGDPGATLEFSGVATNLPVASLVGWTECFRETYGSAGSSIASILASCNQARLLIACRVAGASELLVAANALREDVTFVTGTSNQPHVANGVGWYFDGSYSWGFAPEGAAIERFSCDVADRGGSGAFGEQRLCWHTFNDALDVGYRCGATEIVGGDGFERLIFQAP